MKLAKPSQWRLESLRPLMTTCIDSITEIRRVPNRDTNLNRIYKVNAISRQLVTKEIDLDMAYQRLQDLKESEYPQWLKDQASF